MDTALRKHHRASNYSSIRSVSREHNSMVADHGKYVPLTGSLPIIFDNSKKEGEGEEGEAGEEEAEEEEKRKLALRSG